MDAALLSLKIQLILLDIISNLYSRIILFFFVRTKNYIDILRKLELGVYFFCIKKFTESGNSFFYDMALEEYSHARIFSKILGKQIPELKQIKMWNTLVLLPDNDSFQADGISKKYLCGRLFFGNRSAKDISTSEYIAFMAILEKFQAECYFKLANRKGGEYSEYFQLIGEEEYKHAIGLLELIKTQKISVKVLIKWQLKLILALPFSLYDLWKIKNE